MKLLAINQFGISRAVYNEIETFPSKEEISSMAKAGYKFFLDGKKVTQKKIIEIIRGEESNGSN